MARRITHRELRDDSARVIDAVAGGETLIVTRNGEAVAELRPFQPRRRTFVPSAEVVALAAGGVHLDQHRFRADVDRWVDPEA